MDTSVIGVKEITSVGNPLCVSRAQRALRPVGLPHPTTVLLEISNQMNAVLNLVFDTRGPSWNQPSSSLYLFLAHN
jgi:hypothetical protein